MGNICSLKNKQTFVKNITKKKLSSLKLKKELSKFKNIYYNTKQIKLNHKFILRENSIILLFDGITYGLLNYNEKPFQLLIVNKDKTISASQNWFAIDMNIVKSFILDKF